VGNDAGAEGFGVEEEGADHESPDDGGGPPVAVDEGEEEGDDEEGLRIPLADPGELEVIGGDDGAPAVVAPEELFHERDDDDGADQADGDEAPARGGVGEEEVGIEDVVAGAEEREVFFEEELHADPLEDAKGADEEAEPPAVPADGGVGAAEEEEDDVESEAVTGSEESDDGDDDEVKL